MDNFIKNKEPCHYVKRALNAPVLLLQSPLANTAPTPADALIIVRLLDEEDEPAGVNNVTIADEEEEQKERTSRLAAAAQKVAQRNAAGINGAGKGGIKLKDFQGDIVLGDFGGAGNGGIKLDPFVLGDFGGAGKRSKTEFVMIEDSDDDDDTSSKKRAKTAAASSAAQPASSATGASQNYVSLGGIKQVPSSHFASGHYQDPKKAAWTALKPREIVADIMKRVPFARWPPSANQLRQGSTRSATSNWGQTCVELQLPSLGRNKAEQVFDLLQKEKELM